VGKKHFGQRGIDQVIIGAASQSMMQRFGQKCENLRRKEEANDKAYEE
jgi:hypothetical protein